jgi:hypothetical protein
MSVALKSDSFQPTQPQRRLTSPGHIQPIPLQPLPTPPALAGLQRLQRVSSMVATAVLALSLLSYGVSVYVDQQVGGAVRRLSELQHRQQQIATFNAVLKSHIAAQAELPTSGLQPPKPEAVVFLTPASPRPFPRGLREVSGSLLPGAKRSPLGY